MKKQPIQRAKFYLRKPIKLCVTAFEIALGTRIVHFPVACE